MSRQGCPSLILGQLDDHEACIWKAQSSIDTTTYSLASSTASVVAPATSDIGIAESTTTTDSFGDTRTTDHLEANEMEPEETNSEVEDTTDTTSVIDEVMLGDTTDTTTTRNTVVQKTLSLCRTTMPCSSRLCQ